MRRIRRTHVLLAALAAALSVPAAGAAPGGSGGLPTKIGAGEGGLNLIAWEGYLDPAWVKPFENQTGCKIKPKYAGTSNDMVNLMRTGGGGGGGQYDMVSASGDASLRLILNKDVQAVNVKLIQDWKNFFSSFKSPSNNTVKGVHYGISLQWGPNTLMYNPTKVKPAPTSWSAIYDPKYKGKITIPNNPIQIADAALYLSTIQPSLGIKDPYELTKPQFDATVALLKKQKPLIKLYWDYASNEIAAFKRGDAIIGASWPYQKSQLKGKTPIADLIPKEGTTGWLDTWMLAAKAPHPNCAYLWLRYISTPLAQAQQATIYGETPVNKKACSFMNKLSKGSCAQYHANAPLAYFRSIKFWKTPQADCGNGKKDCVDYNAWQNAWSQIKG